MKNYKVGDIVDVYINERITIRGQVDKITSEITSIKTGKREGFDITNEHIGNPIQITKVK